MAWVMSAFMSVRRLREFLMEILAFVTQFRASCNLLMVLDVVAVGQYWAR